MASQALPPCAPHPACVPPPPVLDDTAVPEALEKPPPSEEMMPPTVKAPVEKKPVLITQTIEEPLLTVNCSCATKVPRVVCQSEEPESKIVRAVTLTATLKVMVDELVTKEFRTHKKLEGEFSEDDDSNKRMKRALATASPRVDAVDVTVSAVPCTVKLVTPPSMPSQYSGETIVETGGSSKRDPGETIRLSIRELSNGEELKLHKKGSAACIEYAALLCAGSNVPFSAAPSKALAFAVPALAHP